MVVDNSSGLIKGFVFRYWDNVGGETLDAALLNASLGARFLVSIADSSVNTGFILMSNGST